MHLTQILSSDHLINLVITHAYVQFVDVLFYWRATFLDDNMIVRNYANKYIADIAIDTAHSTSLWSWMGWRTPLDDGIAY